MRKHLLVTAALLSLCGCSQPSTTTDPNTLVKHLISPTPVVNSVSGSADAPQFRFEKSKREDVPVRLTASDGTGLELVGYKAQAVVNGPLAFTELHLKFKNPQNRVLEGHFEIVLPEKAALSRLAMKNDQGWQEAEVVELQKARQAYEDALHRRQDPALMEKQAGNQFQARVFPIPAQGEKELIISYSQELTSDQDYLLPIGGLPSVADFAVEASLWVGPELPQQHLNYSLAGKAPEGDLAISRTSPTKGLVNQDLTLLSIKPDSKVEPIALQDMVILVDTSASRAAGYKSEIDKVEQLVQSLAETRPQTKVSIAAFDQEVVPVYSGTIKGSQEAFAKLRERRPLGATDLKQALHWAGQQKGYKRLLLVTDGVATEEQGQLEAVSGVERVDALLVGGIRDSQALQELVYHKQASSGLLLDGDRTTSELSRSLLSKTLSGVHVAVKGAEWVWPEVLDGVEPGEERLIYAQIKGNKQDAEVTLSGSAKQEFKIPLVSVSWPLLQRAVVAAQLQRLEGELAKAKGKDAEEISRQIVDMSTRNRVVCDQTALLVLEGDSDYARYGIDRTALRDILVVGKDGVELQHREPMVAQKPPQMVSSKIASTQSAELKKSAPVERAEAAKTERYARDGVANTVAVRGSLDESEPSLGAPSAAAPAPIMAQAPAPAPGYVHYDKAMESQAGSGRAQNNQVGSVERITSATQSSGADSGGVSAESARVRQAAPQPRADVERSSVSHAALQRGAPLGRRTGGGAPMMIQPPGLRTAPAGYYDGDDLNPRHPHHIPPPEPQPQVEEGSAALTGKLLEVHDKIKAGNSKEALKAALDWEADQPGDVLALVALGDSYEATGQKKEAARAYGSIIDLYPGRADLRRFAGCRLDALGLEGQELAADTYGKALEQRPDHPSSYRYRAYALVRLGQLKEAFEVLEKGTQTQFPRGRFLGCDQILREDLALVGAAWAAKEPKRKADIAARVSQAGAGWESQPSLRFVLTWETDANDVDFHIRDNQGGHAFYSQPELASGGRLYADVTTGYGPECFNIPGKAQAGPYKIFIHYYSRGPMGYGMGKVEIVRHDGRGGLAFEERPYVVMNDQAYVDLGTVKP